MLDETPEGHRVHQTQAAAMEEAEAQEEAQAEAQVETMAEDHPAEDHLAEEHQEYLLETPQEETNQGEVTLGMMMNLTTRIRTTIRRMTRTKTNLLHQGDLKSPQAITGTNSTLWRGETAHPGLKPQVQESLKNAITPSRSNSRCHS